MVEAGCGYEFGTTVKPGSARGLQLAVPVFHNDTFEPVLDKRVTEFVRRQFLQADGLTLVNDVGAAPFVLKGRIRSYGLQTLSFRQGFVNEQRVILLVEVSFEDAAGRKVLLRSEEHTSELQSLAYLVCRLLLEKKKKKSSTDLPHSRN